MTSFRAATTYYFWCHTVSKVLSGMPRNRAESQEERTQQIIGNSNIQVTSRSLSDKNFTIIMIKIFRKIEEKRNKSKISIENLEFNFKQYHCLVLLMCLVM